MAFGVSSLKARAEEKSLLRSLEQIVLARLSRKEPLCLAFQKPNRGISMAGHCGRCNTCNIAQIYEESRGDLHPYSRCPGQR